jgi:hypothetical protein
MPVTPFDITLLVALARYYVLTREQLQRLCFPEHSGGRTTRKRLGKLQHGGYVQKHRIPVLLPEQNGAAPIYYLTRSGAELLAAWHEDERYLASNTQQPRGDQLNHWVAVNETRIVIEQAITGQQEVTLDGWINEWEVVDKDAAPGKQFTLHTQFSSDPPLSCSPDAAFLLSLRGHRKVFYVEQDRGTSSPRQIGQRKTRGYSELAERQAHRRHFPEATVDVFGVLFVTTTRYRCREVTKCLLSRPRPDLWLCCDQHEMTPSTFLTGPIWWNTNGEQVSLLKAPAPVSAESAPEASHA